MTFWALWGERPRSLDFQQAYQVILVELKFENPYLNLKEYNCNTCGFKKTCFVWPTEWVGVGVGVVVGVCGCVCVCV